jgi:hypothetical protein
MKIMWEIEDGYAGKSRPHYIDVPDEELDDCETDAEREDLIDGYVQEDFENKIYPIWDREVLKKNENLGIRN